jgi:histidinol-phosphatase (PHP family)
LAAEKLSDNHVHSQFSWDAPKGDMEATCRRAVELGLPSVAFTEHVDWVRGPNALFDVAKYFEEVERCRAAFPGLRVLSGIEMGEPHRYRDEARELLSHGFERVLGSVHCVEWNGRQVDASERGFLTPEDSKVIFREYLRETLELLESDADFEVLSHLDYPKRYWPQEPSYDEHDYEEDFRTVLRAAAKRGVVLEINTTRGGLEVTSRGRVLRNLCPDGDVLRWWREEGGRAVCFASDTHAPDFLAAGFDLARQVAEAAGFKPQDDPEAFWVR